MFIKLLFKEKHNSFLAELVSLEKLMSIFISIGMSPSICFHLESSKSLQIVK